MAARQKVSSVAKRIGVSEKELIFKLQSLGSNVQDADQDLEPEVIQALITGKRISSRARSTILRDRSAMDVLPTKEESKTKTRSVATPRPRADKAQPDVSSVTLSGVSFAHQQLLKAARQYAQMLGSHNATISRLEDRIRRIGRS